MGGDFGPHCVVPASLDYLAENPSLKLILVGPSSLLEHLVALRPDVDLSRLMIVDAEDSISMGDRPTQALRSKSRSSMRVALELVRDGQAQACVSAGNTGALMALARHVLGTIPGIDRPAISASIPTERGPCLLLDLGANVDCTAEHLYQFAVMGFVTAQVLGTDWPRLALLNVGIEDVKGSQQVRLAASFLQQVPELNYQGFVEGDGFYRGEADVVVCDGFAGNVLLKSSEGLAHMIGHRVEALFRRSWLTRLAGLLALPLLRSLREDLMPAQYNGAGFLGLQGIVVKSHGGAGPDGFRAALGRAVREIDQDVPGQLRDRLEYFLCPEHV